MTTWDRLRARLRADAADPDSLLSRTLAPPVRALNVVLATLIRAFGGDRT